MTNYEKIKALSIDDMTIFLENGGTCDYCFYYYDKSCTGCNCLDGVRKFLESEAEEDG